MNGYFLMLKGHEYRTNERSFKEQTGKNDSRVSSLLYHVLILVLAVSKCAFLLLCFISIVLYSAETDLSAR